MTLRPSLDVPAPDAGSAPRFALRIVGPTRPADLTVLTDHALGLVELLEAEFGARIDDLLEARQGRQEAVDGGASLDFLPETAEVRAGDWKVAPIPETLSDRRVEITGPVSAKMVIGALNSGAQCFMADFEDATAPSWANVLSGQYNLRLAVRGTLTHVDAKKGKTYELDKKTATLIVRPRGLHLPEKNAELDGVPVHGALFDAALFLAHNAKKLIEKGSGPYLYLPKLEHHLEARLWNDVLNAAERYLGLTEGTIKTTVLIETLPAVFQMDEILYELRSRCVGLNCGRWDYIFSFIKTFGQRADMVLPDRAAVGMDRHFLESYAKLLIHTCHRRGAFAMGGMAAQVPNRHDADANRKALEKVRADKKREAEMGHDGTWVAHPGLISIARAEMDLRMSGTDQLDCGLEDPGVTAADLVAVPDGEITEEGLRGNLDVALRYLEAWLRGLGCVAIHGLMEDAATAEIARAQIWQWMRHGASLADGRTIDAELVRGLFAEVQDAVRAEVGDEVYGAGHYADASEILERLITADSIAPFLTNECYPLI